jgi:lysozyme family protein
VPDHFPAALIVVLKHEGGFVHDPVDPGGATHYGVSLRSVAALDGDCDGRLDFDLDRDGDVDEADIKIMTIEQAGDHYRRMWWDKYGYGAIADQAVAIKLFDLAVNMGPAQAHKIAQRAIRACWFPLTEDGVLGPQTLSSINAAESRSLVAAMKSEAAGFYRQLAATKPNLGKFLTGWLNRAYS